MMKSNRTVTLRRMVQQVKHCVEEALAVVENTEDTRCAIDDLEHARALLDQCIADARDYAMARGLGGPRSAQAPAGGTRR